MAIVENRQIVLDTLDEISCEVRWRRSKGYPPYISFYRTGLVIFNLRICRELKLKAGHKILIHVNKEKESKEMFLEVGGLGLINGFELLKKQYRLGFSRKSLVNRIFDHVGVDGKSLRFQIGLEPVLINGKQMYEVITKSQKLSK